MDWGDDPNHYGGRLIRTRWQSFGAAVSFVVLAALASASLWAFGAGVLVVATVAVILWVRRRGPLECPYCRYDLSGSPGKEADGAWGVYVCPECGQPLGRYAPPTKQP